MRVSLAQLLTVASRLGVDVDVVEGRPYEVLATAPTGFTFAGEGLHQLVASQDTWSEKDEPRADVRGDLYARLLECERNGGLVACASDCDCRDEETA